MVDAENIFVRAQGSFKLILSFRNAKINWVNHYWMMILLV